MVALAPVGCCRFPTLSLWVVLISHPPPLVWCCILLPLVGGATRALSWAVGLLLMVVLPSSSTSFWVVLFPRLALLAVPLSALRFLAGTAPSLPSWSRLSLSSSPWAWCRFEASALDSSFRFICFSNLVSRVWSFPCHLSFSLFLFFLKRNVFSRKSTTHS